MWYMYIYIHNIYITYSHIHHTRQRFDPFFFDTTKTIVIITGNLMINQIFWAQFLDKARPGCPCHTVQPHIPLKSLVEFRIFDGIMSNDSNFWIVYHPDAWMVKFLHVCNMLRFHVWWFETIIFKSYVPIFFGETSRRYLSAEPCR